MTFTLKAPHSDNRIYGRSEYSTLIDYWFTRIILLSQKPKSFQNFTPNNNYNNNILNRCVCMPRAHSASTFGVMTARGSRWSDEKRTNAEPVV